MAAMLGISSVVWKVEKKEHGWVEKLVVKTDLMVSPKVSTEADHLVGQSDEGKVEKKADEQDSQLVVNLIL